MTNLIPSSEVVRLRVFIDPFYLSNEGLARIIFDSECILKYGHDTWRRPFYYFLMNKEEVAFEKLAGRIIESNDLHYLTDKEV